MDPDEREDGLVVDVKGTKCIKSYTAAFNVKNLRRISFSLKILTLMALCLMTSFLIRY
jgi:hypothetical protein